MVEPNTSAGKADTNSGEANGNGRAPFPYGAKPGQPVVWFHKRPASGNRHCPYCGAVVGAGATVDSNREHVIARNFVPPGAFRPDDFNLIVRACVACNTAKSALERHVSTVTLFTSPSRADPDVDARARAKAARDVHPVKRVPVEEAGDTHTLRANLVPGATATFTLDGPPQLDRGRAIALAGYHLQALFALVASRDPRQTEGTVWLDPAYVRELGVYGHLDWGNPQLVALADRARGWPLALLIRTAGGHFNAILRRRPDAADRPEQWFWGLEWNRDTRLVGVLAAPGDDVPIWRDLPVLDWRVLPGGWRYRQEIPLRPEDDVLFAPPAEGWPAEDTLARSSSPPRAGADPGRA